MRKSKFALALLVGTFVAGSICGITACTEKEPDSTPPPASDVVLNFVAVTKTSWDADTTFVSPINEKDYNLTYNLSLDLKKDKTLKLTGVCKSGSEKTQGGNTGGGPGGPGGPGGMPMMVAEAEGGESETPAITDWTPYNFTMNGTWSEEAGWGYTVKIDNTTIKVDYDLIQGRHNFYYYIAPTINNKKAEEVLVQMQAKDSEYRKTLASNYETYHKKESKYELYAGGDKSKLNIYLMEDKTVASYSGSGSSQSFSGKGSWSIDEATHTMTITSAGKTYVSNDFVEGVGYRFSGLSAGSSGPGGGSSTMTGFVSMSATKKSNELTDKDFEGETILALAGKDEKTQDDYTMEITKNGWAVLYNASGSRFVVCKYEKNAEGNYEITYGENKFTSTKTDSTVTLVMEFTVTEKGSSNQPDTVTEYNITLTGTEAAAD